MWKTIALAAAIAAAAPAATQEPSYTPGTVWDFSQVKVEPGQFEAYLDFLNGDWKKVQEFGKKQGYIVSYHVLSVAHPRRDDPDLILAIEYKDYTPTAQLEANRRKLEAYMRTGARQMETASGERAKLRTSYGNMELQELKLK